MLSIQEPYEQKQTRRRLARSCRNLRPGRYRTVRDVVLFNRLGRSDVLMKQPDFKLIAIEVLLYATVVVVAMLAMKYMC